MIEDQMEYLGIAVANLVNVLNPELIILGGMFAQGSDLILPDVEAKMRQLSFAGLRGSSTGEAHSIWLAAGVAGRLHWP